MTRSLITTQAGSREPSDPLRERPDELVECARRHGAIDPAVPLGEVRVVVLGAQQDLERPGTAHEPSEVLRGAPTGQLTERRLELREDR